MNPPKVSVIVPVYKAERYLRKCVDSLLGQIFTDFEILLIDDGSPDCSGKICDGYAAHDVRVRVIHQPNSGVSVARQHGLKQAIGEYVIHADPDDWVEPDMLQSLYEKAIEEDADMVICDFFVNYPHRQDYMKQEPSNLNHQTVLRNLFQHLHGSCWNKLIRRSCYDKYQIAFDPELSFCEDLYCNASLLIFPLKVSYLPKAFYHYEQTTNPNSLAYSYSKKSFFYDVKLREKFCALLHGTAVYDICERRMCFLIVSRAYEGNVFSSREFRRRCLPYHAGAEKDALGFLLKAKLYLACHGFYALAKLVFPWLISIRLMFTKLRSINRCN
jgi:glycosyltransferase involved in cell wall biosynthesis